MGICCRSRSGRRSAISCGTRTTRGKQKSRSSRATEAWLSVTGTHLLREMRICLLRQDAPPTSCCPSNEEFFLLSMQRVGWLPFWWRANLQQRAGPGQHPGDDGLVRSFQASHESTESRAGASGQNPERHLVKQSRSPKIAKNQARACSGETDRQLRRRSD